METGNLLDKKDIISTLKNVQQLEHFSIDELRKVCDLYPYFLPSRLLLLKKLHISGDFQYEAELKLCSAQALDRKKIYELIYQSQVREAIVQIKEEIEQEQEIPTPKTEVLKDRFEKPIPITKLRTLEPKEEIPKVHPSEPNTEKTEDKKTLDTLEKEILQHAVSYSIEQEVMEDIEEQKLQSIDITPGENANKETTDITHSFNDWLKVLDKANKKEDQPETKSSKDIIDNFIINNPQITKPSKEEQDVFSPTNIQKLNVVQSGDFVTETLAKIYLKQGNKEKAIKAYRKLMLKYPEKKTYFASQIKKIETD